MNTLRAVFTLGFTISLILLCLLSLLVGAVGGLLGLPGPWWFAAGIASGIIAKGVQMEFDRRPPHNHAIGAWRSDCPVCGLPEYQDQ